MQEILFMRRPFYLRLVVEQPISQQHLPARYPVPSMPIYSSPIWNKLQVDSGVAQSDADKLYYAGDFKKSFIWREVWPLNVLQANPSSSEMVSNDTVNLWACSFYGVSCVADPRYTIKSGG